MVQKYLFYEELMGSRVGGREFRYIPYQARKMELFVETANGYFRKKLHLMGSEYASLENANNLSSKRESGSHKNYYERVCD